MFTLKDFRFWMRLPSCGGILWIWQWHSGSAEDGEFLEVLLKSLRRSRRRW